MWISYAGKDSSELVEALVGELRTLCPDLEVTRYKKRVNVSEDSIESDPTASDDQADSEWPVIERRASGAKEQFYLLPMEELFELVLKIAYSPRTLVILSPAYFQSLPCLQELAAIISLENRALPLFVLNGITHEDVGNGVIRLNEVNPSGEFTVDMAQALVGAREQSTDLDRLEFFKPLIVEDVKSYLHKLVSKNVPATTSADTTATDGDNESLTNSSLVSDMDSDLSGNAISIAENVKAHFLDRPGVATYHRSLRESDYKRFEAWLDSSFGRILTQEIGKRNSNTVTAREFVEKLMNDPNDLHDSVVEALEHMRHSRTDDNTDGLAVFRHNDKWNNAISELAGLYALTLVDYEAMASLWRDKDVGNLLFVSFTAGEFQAPFQACVVNASLQESMLRLRPVCDDSRSGAPEVPGFSLNEREKSANEKDNQFAREFVESLYIHVARKTVRNCPGSDPDHATGMNEAERRTLRGQVNRYQNSHGPGSLVLTINRSKFSTGSNWWDSLSEVQMALNDGADAHARVSLRGIVISQNDNAATIKMHPDYEERLDYINELLEDFYLT